MADFLQKIIGGAGKSAETPAASADSDFADFAEAPSPAPVPVEPVAGGATLSGNSPAFTPRLDSKWYRIDQRHQMSEFRAEGIILAAIVVLFTLHFIGTRLNKSKAKKWVKANAPSLSNEFSQVGFDSSASSLQLQSPEKLLKGNSLFEYSTYATGRQNVAFVDLKLTLKKRFNPLQTVAESLVAFFVESMSSPQDVCEATLYPFDGKEQQIVPGIPGAEERRSKDPKSNYDGFVWAVINKEQMKQLRNDRYDLSITFTKDHPKLPNWLTVMSESAEITDALLTSDLIAAIDKAKDSFESFIVSDQPIDKPKKMDETVPRKRVYLRYRLPSNNRYDDLVPLLEAFLRFGDHLAASAHFRPEVMRKVKAVREDAIKQLQKIEDDLKAEDRAMERDKARKAKREAELNALDAKAQKKYLDKEKEKQMRKASRKQTMRA